MEQQEEFLQDIKEALGAMTGDPVFATQGIDAAFIDMFARNMSHFEKLRESTKEKIKTQFLDMAFEKSYRDTVARKTSEDKSKAMVAWFKGVNLLLAMSKRGMA